MRHNTKIISAAKPHQVKGGRVRREAVAKKVADAVAEIRREHYAGTLSRRRLIFHYVAKTRADVTPATVKGQDYHETSETLIEELLKEVNGEATPCIRQPRKPKPRVKTLSERVADAAREAEVAKYAKAKEAQSAEDQRKDLLAKIEMLERQIDGMKDDSAKSQTETSVSRRTIASQRTASASRQRSGR